jgi:hypothetical protein
MFFKVAVIHGKHQLHLSTVSIYQYSQEGICAFKQKTFFFVSGQLCDLNGAVKQVRTY